MTVPQLPLEVISRIIAEVWSSWRGCSEEDEADPTSWARTLVSVRSVHRSWAELAERYMGEHWEVATLRERQGLANLLDARPAIGHHMKSLSVVFDIADHAEDDLTLLCQTLAKLTRLRHLGISLESADTGSGALTVLYWIVESIAQTARPGLLSFALTAPEWPDDVLPVPPWVLSAVALQAIGISSPSLRNLVLANFQVVGTADGDFEAPAVQEFSGIALELQPTSHAYFARLLRAVKYLDLRGFASDEHAVILLLQAIGQFPELRCIYMDTDDAAAALPALLPGFVHLVGDPERGFPVSAGYPISTEALDLVNTAVVHTEDCLRQDLIVARKLPNLKRINLVSRLVDTLQQDLIDSFKGIIIDVDRVECARAPVEAI